jgi:hypothetical protein
MLAEGGLRGRRGQAPRSAHTRDRGRAQRRACWATVGSRGWPRLSRGGPLRRRARAATEEANDLEREILGHVRANAPEVLNEPGVGPIVAAQLIVSWSHHDRVRSEACELAAVPSRRGSRRPAGLLLRGQRASVRRAELNPLDELALRPNVFGVDSQPPTHRPATHFEEASVRPGDELVRPRRVDPNKDATLAARCHGHVAADEEREPTEHLLLGETGFADDQLADTRR